MKTLHIDFETFSGLDLRKVGVENYVRHPDFAVTSVAWAFDGASVRSAHYPCALPVDVRAHIHEGGIIKAWNAAFEWNVLTYHYGLNVSHEQMDCVMQRSLAYGLPASLYEAGVAMGVPTVKDRTARALMLQMGRPKKDGTAWHMDQSALALEKLKALAAYCTRDVEAERALDKVIPALTDFDKKLSVIDARINERGVLIDGLGAASLQAAAFHLKAEADAECTALTNGQVTSPGTQTARLMEWLAQNNCPMKDLSKESVEKALTTLSAFKGLHDRAKRVLELRKLSAKSSVAKLERMAEVASSHDGRARNLFQFYGAGRTGRWAGRLIQVQNLPRPDKGLDAEQVIGLCVKEPKALGLFHANPMRSISGALRGCLIARPGHMLVSLDLSQIEARVLAWIAGQTDIVDAFRQGADVYTHAAHKVGSSDRMLGKVLTLACGYGMGGNKFKETAATYGLDMTTYQADSYVTAWRNANSRIKSLWFDFSVASKLALGVDPVKSYSGTPTGEKGGLQNVRGVHMRYDKATDTFRIRKPNGGVLYYHHPRIVDDEFLFHGAEQKTGSWMALRSYGGKFVENLVQAVARDVMAEGMLNSGAIPIMTIHDEIVWEVPEAEAKMLADRYKWAVENGGWWTSGLPLASEIKISRRFGK